MTFAGKVGAGTAVGLAVALTLVAGGGSDVDEDGADVEAPPVPHAVSVRPKASTRSVGLRDATMTSGSARDLGLG
jgi:hypothetical protein